MFEWMWTSKIDDVLWVANTISPWVIIVVWSIFSPRSVQTYLLWVFFAAALSHCSSHLKVKVFFFHNPRKRKSNQNFCFLKFFYLNKSISFFYHYSKGLKKMYLGFLQFDLLSNKKMLIPDNSIMCNKHKLSDDAAAHFCFHTNTLTHPGGRELSV